MLKRCLADTVMVFYGRLEVAVEIYGGAWMQLTWLRTRVLIIFFETTTTLWSSDILALLCIADGFNLRYMYVKNWL